jgi:acyl-CoA synthetase (AMP-forming)/AMP-acid ligase II/aryl carrier-like protein
MFHATTLSGLLESHLKSAGGITHVYGDGDLHDVSFVDLRARSLGILRHLQNLGARPGCKLMICIGSTELFIEAFWAATLGGIIPVPVSLGLSDQHRHKMLRIARQLGSPFICTERRRFEGMPEFAARAGAADVFDSLRARSIIVDVLDDISLPGVPHEARPQDLALIQYSSGSTSEPRGVMLTHSNLLANIRGLIEITGINENDSTVTWMPLTHDMGLIGTHLMMSAMRARQYFMPAERFVRRPLLWLQLASRTRATILFSPNFGYQYYLKVLGERPVSDLDLSAVRLIFNGAEPISARLCNEFLTRLAAAGLARHAMYPVYGLAEASVGVSLPTPGAPIRSILVNRHSMNVGQRVEFLPPEHDCALELISEGRPYPGCGVRIAADDDIELPEDHVGHVQVRGDNVTQGYYEMPLANAAAFTTDGWLRTGDLGIVHRRDLYICGRTKEIIFANGQNYYPHDVEAIAQLAPGVELGAVVAAAVRPRGFEAEQCMIFVIHRGGTEDFLPIADRITHLIGERASLEVSAVVPVTRFPKTTSGKIQRHVLARCYVDGEFDAVLEELEGLRAAGRNAHPAMLSDIERTLLRFCENILGDARVGVHDNLFEIGVSSLTLIRIHEDICRVYPSRVELADLFEVPTIAALAQRLAAAPPVMV